MIVVQRFNSQRIASSDQYLTEILRGASKLVEGGTRRLLISGSLESEQKAWQLTAEHCLNEVRHNWGRNARTNDFCPMGLNQESRFAEIQASSGTA
jgi:hypothetical protein